MADTGIRPELVSLIHHVELNKAGWWDGAIRQFILAAIWLTGTPLNAEGVRDVLHNGFSVSPDPELMGLQIRKLCETGQLIQLPSGDLKISEKSLHQLESNLEEAEAIETEAEAVFTKYAQQACPEIDPIDCWRHFNGELLFPLVREIGARTYELISGSTRHLDKIGSFQIFLQRYPAAVQPRLRDAIVLFMNPTNASVRSYILRHLNAYFSIEASNLTQHTLEVLSQSALRNTSFEVFVDTNFLFSILGLHENPSNEAADSLISLMQQLKGKVTAKLFLFPLTIDEFKRVVRSHQQFLSDLRLEPNLAAVGIGSGLTGVALKFIQESKQIGHPLKASDYFGPYLEDLLPIIRGKGLELYNARVDEYTKRQDVIDDILIQQQYELRFPPEKRKSYDQLLHDVCLWHFVKDRRLAQVESPADAKCWVVTVDYRFLGFDGYKRQDAAKQIPVAVHPTTLIQLLQLWLPRTQAFEEAIVRSLRFAFLFHDFDSNSERITVRILESLSRFEDIRDLSQDVAASVLMNQALRARLTGATTAEQDIALVKEALVEENNKTAARLHAANETSERLASESRQKDSKIVELEDLIEQSNRAFEDLAQTSSGERIAWEERLRSLEESRGRTSFLVLSVCIPLIAIFVVGLGIVHIARSIGNLGYWWSAILLWGIQLAVWLYLTDRRGSRNESIRDWAPFAQFHRLKKWLFTIFLVSVPTKLVVDGIYKAYRYFFP
jgi:uncharacterized protein YwgA